MNTESTNTYNENNSTRFRMAVKMAMGLRTQKQFASDIGTTPQYLSRLMSGTVRPTMKTLEHIAAHADNGITLQSLRKACGYNDPQANASTAARGYQPKKTILDYNRASDFGYVVGLAAARMKNYKANSPTAYVDIIVETIKNFEQGQIFSEDNNVSGELIGDVTRDGVRTYQETDFTFRVPKYIARVKVVLSWINDLTDGLPRNFALSTDARTLKQYFPTAIDPAIEDDPEVIFDPDSAYVEKQYLMPTYSNDPRMDAIVSLFGPQDAEEVRVPEIEEGYGFYTDDISNDTAIEFCTKYKNFWPEGLENPENYHDTDEEEPNGVLGLIAYILRNMTGILFVYCDPKIGLKEGETLIQDKPTIMVDEDRCNDNGCTDFSGYSRSTVLQLCARFAAELGVKKYGSVWVQGYIEHYTEPEYNTIFPDKNAVKEFIDEE